MLNVQQYLRSGKTPEDLNSELAIEFRRKDGKVIFTYSMWDSPKNHPIVKECRGLILYEDNWDIACYGFERFLNYSEDGTAQINDLTGTIVLQKLDGTMVNVYYDRNDKQHHISTRSMIDADGPVGDLSDKTFAQLFWEGTLEDCYLKDALGRHRYNNAYVPLRHMTFVFELTSPINRIVTPYKNTSITLLTARHNDTAPDEAVRYKELTRSQMNRLAGDLGVKLVKSVSITNFDELLSMQGLEPTDEGFVIVKETGAPSHQRVKCKNPAYLAIAHLIEGPSRKNFLKIIQSGGVEEVLSYYPQYEEEIILLYNRIEHILQGISVDYGYINSFRYDNGTLLKDRKKFARLATERCLFPGIMFALYDEKITFRGLEAYLMSIPAPKLLEMIDVIEKNIPYNNKKWSGASWN